MKYKVKMTLAGFVAVGALMLGMSTESFANIIYNVNRTIGTGGVVGTLETDGTIGVLGTANVVEWNLTLSDGTDTFILDGPAGSSNSNLLLLGSDLTATLTGVFFDFGGTGFALFQNPSNGSGINWWCLEGSSCSGNPNSETTNVDGPIQVAAQRGIVQVASTEATVPEPSILALLGLGLLGLGFSRRKKA